MSSKQAITRTVAKLDSGLTIKQDEILQALVTGMNQTDAAEFVGVSREYVCRLCQMDHFLKEIDKLRTPEQ